MSAACAYDGCARAAAAYRGELPVELRPYCIPHRVVLRRKFRRAGVTLTRVGGRRGPLAGGILAELDAAIASAGVELALARVLAHLRRAA